MSVETPNFTIADVRAWALASGYEVGTRGRIARPVLDAFNEAHGTSL